MHIISKSAKSNRVHGRMKNAVNKKKTFTLKTTNGPTKFWILSILKFLNAFSLINDEF